MEENGNYYMEQTSNNGEFHPQRWATQNTGGTLTTQGLRGRALNISASPFRGFRADNTSTNAFGRIVDWTRYDNEGYTSEEALGDNQKGVEQFGNALLNNLVIAGTTAVENTIGLGWGLLKGLSGESIWDNKVNRAMNSIQEYTQENNPIYHSKGYNEKSALGRVFTTEFWADNLQNLGFTEGMLVSSLVPGALLKNAGTAANIIVKSLYSSFGEAATEALNAKKDKQKLEETQAIQLFKEKTSNLTLVPQNQRDSYKQELYEDFKRDITNIRQDANTVGNAVLYQNLAILTLTGAGEFGPLFKRGANSAAIPFRQKLAKNGLKTFEDTKGALTSVEMSLSKPKAITSTTIKTVGRASLEGLEEFSQNIATRVGDTYIGYNSFNNSRFNPEAREMATDLVHAGTMAIAEAVKDKDVWTEFLSGMVTGFTGGPMVRSPKNSQGTFQSPITLEGATAEGVREIREYNRKAQIVNSINERLQDPKFQEYYEHLTRDIYLTDKINTAIDKADDFNLKNYELAKVISDVSLFESVGLLDNYKSTIASFSNLDENSINSLISETTSSDGKDGPFVVNGNPMSLMEVKEKLTSNSKFILDKIDRYNELKQLFTALHPELSKDVVENYLYGSIQVEDWVDRESNILNELYNIYKDYSIENLSDNKVLSKNDFKKLTPKELNEVLSAPFVSLNPTEREKFNKKIQDLNKIDTSINIFQKRLEEIIKDPIKANKNSEKQKEIRVNKVQELKVKNLSQSLSSVSNFSDIRNILNNNTTDSALNNDALRTSSNPIVQNYFSLLQKVSLIKSKLNGIEPQTKEDITKILDNIINKAEEFEDFDTSSILMADLDVLKNSDVAQETSVLQARLDKALNIIDRLLVETSVDDGRGQVVIHTNDTQYNSAQEKVDEEPVTGNSESPTPKPIEVNMEGTKAPDVADTNLSYSKDSQGQVEYYIKDSETTPEDLNTVASSETAAVSLETPKSGSIIPSSSQYDLTGMNTKDKYGNPKDVQFIPVAEAGQANHQYLSTNGPTQDAFNWINKGYLARYKEKGGKLYFGIDPRLDSELPIVFVKDPDGQFFPVATLYKSKAKNTQYGLTAFYDSLLEEFKANPTEDTPYVSSNWESSIDEVMKGRIPYTTNQSRDIQEALVGTEIDASNAELVVDADNEIIGTSNVSDYANSGSLVSGMSYIAVPNARRTTSFRGKTLVPVIPKFYREISEQGGEFTKRVNAFLNQLAQNAHSSDTKRKALEAFNALGNYLNLARVDIVIDKDIIIKEAILDEKGHKQFKTKDGREYIESKPILSISSSASNEEIIAALKSAFSQVNVPIRVNKANVRERNYVKMMIEENLLKTFATSLKSEGAYFSMSSPVRLDSKDENPVEKEITREITGNPELTEDDYSSILASETVATPKVPKQEERKTEKTTPKVLNPTENSRKELTEEEKARLLKDHSQEWLDNASNEEILYALTCKGF